MNERTFLNKIAEDEVTRTRLKAEVAATLADFARSEEITLDEMSEQQIQELADGFVKRGLNQ